MKKILIATIASLFFTICSIQPAKSQCKAELLEAFGASSGLCLYNTYMVIGSVADAYEYGAYDSTLVKKLIDEQVATIGNMKSMYQKVLDTKSLNTEDAAYVKDVIDCFSLLKNQGSALLAYLKKDTKENSDYFQTCRKKSWSKICSILGIEE